MATSYQPFGLNPIGRLDSGSLEPMRQLPIKSAEATSIVKGDVVKLVSSSNKTTVAKMTDTGDTTTEVPIVGIFMGCRYTDPNTNQLTFSQTFVGGTVASDAMAYVVADPNVIFEIAADGAVANENEEVFGSNFALVQGTANTTLGISRVGLDIDSLSTDPQLPIKVIDYRGGFLGDEVGTDFPVLIAKFNYHQFLSKTGLAAV